MQTLQDSAVLKIKIEQSIANFDPTGLIKYGKYVLITLGLLIEG